MKTLAMALFALLLASPARAQLTTGLISYWTLDEVSGDRLDIESNGSPQHLSEADANGSTPGKIGNACDFESSGGAQSYLIRQDNADLSLGADTGLSSSLVVPGV